MMVGGIPSVGSSSSSRSVRRTAPAPGPEAVARRRKGAADPIEERRQPGKVGQHGVDDHTLARLSREVAHAQIVARRKVRKNGAALRDVAHTGAGPAVGRKPRHVLALEADPSGGDRKLSDERAQQRRLSHAVVAENADHSDRATETSSRSEWESGRSRHEGLRSRASRCNLLAEIDVADPGIAQDSSIPASTRTAP